MKPRSRKNNALDSDSDSGSETPDTDAYDGSRDSSRAPKRKSGRASGSTNKKRQRLQDDSDQSGSPQPSTSQNGNGLNRVVGQSNYEEHSDDSVQSVTTASGTPAPAVPKRGRGRPPSSRKKRRRVVNGSARSASPQPSTSQNADDQMSDHGSGSDSGSESSVSIDGIAPTPTPQRRGRGRPPSTRQRMVNGSVRDASPQPSTSQNADDNGSGSESGSESADSDYGPVNEKSVKKKPPPAVQKRVSPRKRKPAQPLYVPAVKQSQSNEVTFDAKDVESLAQKLTYFLLIEDQKKYAIRRKAIVTNVFKDEPYTPKLYTAVIKKANIILKKTFGMEIMELENQKDSYLLVNILRRELGIHDYVDLPRIKQQQYGLILFILTVIFMNENAITEDELTKCLKPLGVDLMSKRLHPVFGDVKKYITTELVKQMYLNYECISKEPPNYEITWGIRAKQEFDKSDLLQYACQIMDDTVPEDWRIQFRDAESSAKPSADDS